MPLPVLSGYRRGLILALVFTAGLGAAGLRGQVAPEPLSLAQAQQRALRNNPDIHVAQTQVAAALAQLRVTREFPNPVAGISVSDINTDGRSNATAAGNRFIDRSYDTIISLSQLLEIGKRGVRQTAAQAAVRGAEARRDDGRRLLVQAVSQAYVAALEAQEEARVLAESTVSLRKEAGIAASRQKAGDIAAADQAQIEIAAAQTDIAAGSARAVARTSLLVLTTLLGEAPGAVVLSDSLDQLPVDALEAAGPAGVRPDILAAEAAVTQAEADLKLQKRGVVPDLTVSVQYEREPPDQPNTAGVGVSFPLPLWNRNTGATLAAKAARDQAEAELDKVRVQAAAELATLRVTYEEARSRAETYRNELQPKSADITRTVAYAYQQGGAALVELLAAERSDNDIRLAAVHARADQLSAAAALEAALNRSTAAAVSAPAP
jgi:cobalt-zinc-cadmium efflux system outer membrane protein